MNARQPTAAHSTNVSSATVLLLEIEMPHTTAFEAFEEQLDVKLAELEDRFSSFVTPNSFAGAIGR
ncbi:MAG TPA: hypothetical protein P5307_02610 [Pirellulaceae bacterium]|nr:hypothetical protein [Planctomycetales bacterium]MCB9940764.1 hypothetical protein [Planctomycetaceae bacterium]HRX77922.1 hypothetical protein [Pirellulaceae bacterium]